MTNLFLPFMLIAFLLQFNSVFSESVGSTDGYIHEPGYCVMYDECAYNANNGKKLNCLYNNKAKLLTDKDGLALLQEVCPYLYQTDNTTKTCCSINQLHTLKDNLQLPYQYLSRCPSCYSNFVALFCEMTCSPDQSVFTFVQKNETGNDTSLNIVPYNQSSIYISVLGYNITNQFADAMFNSCNHVNSPSTNTPALKILCGPYADSCTPQKWITYMDDLSNGQTPFQINPFFFDDPTKGMNYTADRCNEPSRSGESACSCSDCPAACSGPPPVPPPPPSPWLIWGVSGYYIVMIFSFMGFLLIFGMILLLKHLCYRKQIPYTTLDDDCRADGNNSVGVRDDLGQDSVNGADSSNKPGMIERWGHFLETLLQSGFQKMGTFCARNPYIVLLIGAIVIAVCAIGLKFMTVTTDPVELWSAPTSQTRQRKNYYDQHFGPFYRTEELIITAPNSNRTIYSPYTSSSDPKDKRYVPFGPILSKDVLMTILELQNKVTSITAKYKNRTVRLEDICLKPLAPQNNNCTILSPVNYFQNSAAQLNKIVMVDEGFSLGADYHDHLISCTSGPAAVDDATFLHMSCLGTYGGPIFPWVALGGYDGKNYLNATAAVVTIPVVNYYNDSEKLDMALAWEKEFISFMKQWQLHSNGNLLVQFSAERSIEDEINRESGADILTIVISYLLMFLYVAIALGRFSNLSRIFIDSQMMVGLSGVLFVLCSVAMSLGIFSYAGVPVTLIIVEVVPFLALAVGVDNIFLLVQHLQRDVRHDKESIEEQLGRVLGEVAPSLFLSAISETIAFFLGGLSTMPAVRTFSMFAGLALFCDFLLQITCFVAVLAIDSRRQASNRADILCCVELHPDGEAENDGVLYSLFKNYFSPCVLSKFVRPIVIIFFIGIGCFSGAVLHQIDIGLDQKLSMPEDSYVLGYFDYLNKYLSTGAPVYFVVPEGQDYAHENGANQVCGTTGCNNNSLIEQISFMAQMPNYSHIAYPASSWIDDYFDWLKPQSSCCRYQEKAGTTQFCDASVISDNCTDCRSGSEVHNHPRPSPQEFMDFLPWFLKDNPGIHCGKGGHAAYGGAVNIIKNGNKSTVGATYFMGYHTIARTSSDFIGCLRMANEISANISKHMEVEVFPYSVFYVFYEQYLTIVHDTIFNLGISVLAVFLVVFVVLGFDVISAILVVVTIGLILLDMFGCMYLWDIPLNAVSLVNLVMAVGISVEFCAHVTRAFALSHRRTRVGRAKQALAEKGSSVFSGITLTKFIGIVILAFSKSQIFRVFYFRMYLCVVLLGASHGLVFLPVLLSYLGPPRRSIFKKHKLLENEDGETSSADDASLTNAGPVMT